MGTDPPLALSRAFARLRPGGLLCLQEPDLAAPRAAPPMPTWEQAHGRLLETMRRAGVEARMGHTLFAAFRAAGLPDPEMHVESAVRCGERAGHAAHRRADLLVATLPLMERTGVTTRVQLAPDTLGDRLEAELTAHDGIVMLGPLSAAWARA
ncbi:hypothetical protein [Streptomyces sp. HNM0574]|uniref:hypothetical protein n=1 Tax=Streptomyces sp. HNM0574 TaxID=2714954 RepID=UPI00146F096A|nr:hypothetical protein [Streptomyces sp. HNM0574]NLU68836.1 hypothetical protein [Streptomyces sp. HNM0574]